MPTPMPRSMGMAPVPSMVRQVPTDFQFPPTTPLTPHQLDILHAIQQHLVIINHMRRGFFAMSRTPPTTTTTTTAISSAIASAAIAAVAAVPTPPRVLWARKLSISLSNIQIALCSFCLRREDKSGGDVDLLVEILEPVKALLDVVAKCYYELQVVDVGGARVDKTQAFSYAVTGAEAHLRAVMRTAGCWWEDMYFASVEARRGMAVEEGGRVVVKENSVASDDRTVSERSVVVKEESVESDDGTVSGRSVVSDDRTAAAGSIVSDDRTILERSVVSDDRKIWEGSVALDNGAVTESSPGVEELDGSVWSAGPETGSTTTTCEEHSGQNTYTSTRDSPGRDTVSAKASSSPEPDRDTASFTSGDAESEDDTSSFMTGSAEPEEDPWNDELFACTSSPVWHR
ncbi:hypothetical protein DFP73DRAFT_524842 [Morchella snyderi]|nr:hypothetical protein DFP73DRAFT_524842 [Morchella snyderi]